LTTQATDVILSAAAAPPHRRISNTQQQRPRLCAGAAGNAITIGADLTAT